MHPEKANLKENVLSKRLSKILDARYETDQVRLKCLFIFGIVSQYFDNILIVFVPLIPQYLKKY